VREAAVKGGHERLRALAIGREVRLNLPEPGE
jgi:hypothetical protein